MSTGCCYAKKSLVTSTYRAAKAGSGWRILTLTGYLELSNKESIAYAYFNDESETFESEVIEKVMLTESAIKTLLEPEEVAAAFADPAGTLATRAQRVARTWSH